MNKPEANKLYALTGGTGEPCIANGNTWAESEVNNESVKITCGEYYAPEKYKQGWRYVVWVGGCDDYYTTYQRAKEHYEEWIEQGYDGVHLMELSYE